MVGVDDCEACTCRVGWNGFRLTLEEMMDFPSSM
jgi:hypothetical protein